MKIFPDIEKKDYAEAYNKRSLAIDTKVLTRYIEFQTLVRKQNESGLWYLVRVTRSSSFACTKKEVNNQHVYDEALSRFLQDVYMTLLYYKYSGGVGVNGIPMETIDTNQQDEYTRLTGIEFINK